jgi:hypothetical protein
MLRFCLLASLALAIAPTPLHAGDTHKAPKTQERSVERFLNGSDAEREAMVNDVVKILATRGYRELSVVPWFVMMAKNSGGQEVLLLVDPVSLQVIEIQHEGDEIAAAPETAIPKLRN